MRRAAIAAAIAATAIAGLGVVVALRERAAGVAREGRAECLAARALHADVLGHRSADGAFATLITLPSDPWTSGEAAVALAAYGAPEDREAMETLTRFISAAAVRRKDGSLLGWVLDPAATLASGEPSAYAIAGIAAARARYGLGLDDEVRRLARWLAAAQSPDGSYSFVFGVPAGSRASATQDAMLALLIAAAGEAEPLPEITAALTRAAAHAARTYDESAGGFSPGPGFPAQAAVPGLSELYAWLLLETRDALADAGAPFPPAALAALHAYAGRIAPSALPLDTVGMLEATAYQVALPANEIDVRYGGHSWSWAGWRLLALARLARLPDVPRKAEIEAEEIRLRESVRGLPQALQKAYVFVNAECLTMAATLCHGDPADARYGSLYRVLRDARRER